VTSQRARAITERAVSERYKLTEKPVKMAINEIANGLLVGELKPEFRRKLEG
jgi:DNA-directed RNA polymerase subunit K/omega